MGPPYDQPPPAIRTARLVLRPFEPADAAALREAMGDARVAATSLNIPHPMTLEIAAAFIAEQPAKWAAGDGVAFGVFRDDRLIGGVRIDVSRRTVTGEMGFWMAVDCWGKGYCTEAARAALAFAFETMGLARVGAHHFSNNLASGRVLEKIGMLHEGRLRDAVLKDGQRYDAILYGMTRSDWERAKG